VFKVYYGVKFGVGSLPQRHSTMLAVVISTDNSKVTITMLALCSM